MEDEDGWTTQTSRKSRRQKAILAQPNGPSVGGNHAQRSGRRQLPEWLKRGYEPPPPWRTGGSGGQKPKKKDGAGFGRPWPFQGGASKPHQGEKVPCGNPRCPGIDGRQSFKYEKTIGRGQHGWECLACDMPWRHSWEVYFNGQLPPSWGPPKGGQRKRWADLDDDEWDDEDDAAESPAYDALDDTYKGILSKIVALPDESSRQEAMDHYKSQDSPMGKAMLAAFTEVMATRQAAERPVLRHPAGEPAGDMEALRKDKNKAEMLHRSAAALVQKKSLEGLALQEQLAQIQAKVLQNRQEHAEAIAQEEETSKDLALKKQQMQAAIARRERELLLAAEAPSLPSKLDPVKSQEKRDEQAKKLVEAVSLAVTRVKPGDEHLQGIIQAVLEALAPLIGASQPGPKTSAGSEPPQTPPLSGEVQPTPLHELNEDSMDDINEGKRKPDDDAADFEHAEAMAAESLLGNGASAAKQGKKPKVAAQVPAPTLAQTIMDADALTRVVNKGLRKPEGPASASGGLQSG